VDDNLKTDSILTAEFNYIANSAFQANEDRAKVTTLYLITVGSFLASMLAVQLDSIGNLFASIAFATLFIILSGYAIISLLQLTRLRLAWYDSARAMNRIKDYYIANMPDVSLEEAFEWKTETLPAKYKPWSVSFLLALQVALLGGASLGAAILFFGLGLSGEIKSWMWIIAILMAILYVADLIVLYWWLLRDVDN
jgi:uncharacterized membrane protein